MKKKSTLLEEMQQINQTLGDILVELRNNNPVQETETYEDVEETTGVFEEHSFNEDLNAFYDYNEFVPLEIAILLKEKGFDIQTRDFYRKENEKWFHRVTYEYNYFNTGVPRWENCYACPTISLAMHWLRSVHKLFIRIDNDDLDWNYDVLKLDERDENDDTIIVSPSYGGIESYEIAALRGIELCLKELIK